jgi:hypothetical protein
MKQKEIRIETNFWIFAMGKPKNWERNSVNGSNKSVHLFPNKTWENWARQIPFSFRYDIFLRIRRPTVHRLEVLMGATNTISYIWGEDNNKTENLNISIQNNYPMTSHKKFYFRCRLLAMVLVQGYYSSFLKKGTDKFLLRDAYSDPLEVI